MFVIVLSPGPARTDRTDGRNVAKAVLHAAMADVANGDPAYSRRVDATSFYGWGGYQKGWTAVEQRWDWAGRQFRGGTVRYENVTTVVGAELAYMTDIETFEARMDGMERPARWSNRVTTSSASRTARGGSCIATPTG